MDRSTRGPSAPGVVSSSDYHIQPNSPAIDAGIDASAVTNHDIDCSGRPVGAGWDIGADEVGNLPTSFKVQWAEQP